MSEVEERAKEFCGYFITPPGAGWPDRPIYPHKSAAAIGGNAWLESAVRPIIPSHDGSDGALQWRDAADVHRLASLKFWCANLGHDWQTLKAQAEFCIFELQTDFKALNADLLAGTKTLQTLTLDFCDIFERPAASGRVPDTRIQFAIKCSDLIAQQVPQAPRVPPAVAIAPIKPIPSTEVTMTLDPAILQLIPVIVDSITSTILKIHAAQTASPGTAQTQTNMDDVARNVLKQLQVLAPHLFDPAQLTAWMAKAQVSFPKEV